MKTLQSGVRLNKEIWRLAEWLCFNVGSWFDQPLPRFTDYSENTRNELYDRAVELKKRMTNGVFT